MIAAAIAELGSQLQWWEINSDMLVRVVSAIEGIIHILPDSLTQREVRVWPTRGNSENEREIPENSPPLTGWRASDK